MKDLFKGDFDFGIRDIILIHNYNYVNGYRYDGYIDGRRCAGIVYCLTGSALYRFENKQISLKSGELLFLTEKSTYSVECTSQENFCHITLNFDISFCGVLDEYFKDFNEIADNLVIKDNFEAGVILEKILNIWLNKKNGYKVKSKGLVYELLYKYFIVLQKRDYCEEFNKVKAAKKYIDEHYTECIQIRELAKMCRFSESHFRRIFYNCHGCSPNEYKLKKRIEKAKDLLLTEEMTVGEVSLAVGFEDANYFSRIFKKQTGKTPREYGDVLLYSGNKVFRI